jgi:hypothetical protein
VAGITADVAIFPAGTQGRRRKIRRRWPTSGPVDLPGELRVSPRSRWTSSPPSSWPESPPESQSALCRHGRGCPGHRPAWPSEWASGPNRQRPWVNLTQV